MLFLLSYQADDVTHFAKPPSNVQRMAIAVRGVVQGVGFRPFVYNAATGAGLAGWVRNETDLVRIEIQGPRAAIDAFVDTLRHDHPPQARLDQLEITPIDVDPAAEASFAILASRELASRRPSIPADLATCEACLAEIRDPREQRYGYPFTNCTNCGPRWSIIEGLPYDRPRTSMSRFAMCRACQAEYVDPSDRRFHAQPIACPECGPRIELLDTAGGQLARDDEAMAGVAEALLQGQIVALKGLGGFQLLVDATSDEAVKRLRHRKRRPAKPLALMVHTIDDAREICEVDGREAELLCSPAAPIVLLRRNTSDESTIARSVAPGNPELGIMLPYTPLHHLLMDRLRRPIVCTSGNLAEEPMATHTAEAIERLGQIADVILTHDRPIVRPVDDSVVRCDEAGPVLLRRARGYAPLPIELADDGPVVLAVGGHLKNTVALRLGRQVVLGSHVGDLDSPQSWVVHRRAIDDLLAFFDVRPEMIACDAHPDYMSTQNAERLAEQWQVPLVRIQHHHAHVAACMAEHQLTGPVLGLAWDGSGFGPDGTVWGGEVLWCEGTAFRRMAHLRTFGLPGGDQAVRRPQRTALGLLFELDESLAEEWAARWYSPAQRQTLLAMLRQQVRCPRTSSMGRLFDAVAALCELSMTTPSEGLETNASEPVISFEGEAAMGLQFAAEADTTDEAYPIALVSTEPIVADWGPMVRAILADRTARISAGRIGRRFHNTLAELALQIARRAGCSRIVLSGGCFQNRLLAEAVRAALSKSGFNVYTQVGVPPGDGGIALGQAYLAGNSSRSEQPCV